MATAPATLHRLEPVHIFLAVFWAAATVLMVVAAWDQDAVRFALTVGADGLILLYLGTVAAWVRVTPTHLLVVNPFVRYAVPRHLIRDVNAEDYWFVPRMLVDGGKPIRLVVLNSNLPIGMDTGSGHRQGQLVMRMVREAPAGTSEDGATRGVQRKIRWANLVLAVLMVVSAVNLYVSTR